MFSTSKNKTLLLALILLSTLAINFAEGKEYLKDGLFQNLTCTLPLTTKASLCDWKGWIFYPMFPLADISDSETLNGSTFTQNKNPINFVSYSLPLAQQIQFLQKGCYTLSLDVYIDLQVPNSKLKLILFLQQEFDVSEPFVQISLENHQLKKVNSIKQQFYLSQDFKKPMVVISAIPVDNLKNIRYSNVSIQRPERTSEEEIVEERNCQYEKILIEDDGSGFNFTFSDEFLIMTDKFGEKFRYLDDSSRMYISGPWRDLQVWEDEDGEFYVRVANDGRKYLTGQVKGRVAFPDSRNDWYFINDKGAKEYMKRISGGGAINLQKN